MRKKLEPLIDRCRAFYVELKKTEPPGDEFGLGDAKPPADMLALGEPIVRDIMAIFEPRDSKPKGEPLGLVAPVFATVVLLCADARLKLAMEGEDDATNCQLTVALTTDAVRIIELLKKVTDHSFLDEESYAYQTRGQALARLGNIDGAIRDLRATVALHQRRCEPSQNDDLAKEHLLIEMAKSNLGKPRPHYTPGQRSKVYKELGIIDYDGNYKCHSCGAAKTHDGRPLQKCSKCSRAFYCSSQCQRAHWPSHKPQCLPLVSLNLLDPSMRDIVESDLTNQGFAFLYNDGPKVFVRDPATGELFDSLTNQPAIFASDAEAAPYLAPLASLPNVQWTHCHARF